MRDYVLQGVALRDGATPLPGWMQRIQVWACGQTFIVDCGRLPLDEATALMTEALLYVLKRRGRVASPLHDADGNVRGMQW